MTRLHILLLLLSSLSLSLIYAQPQPTPLTLSASIDAATSTGVLSGGLSVAGQLWLPWSRYLTLRFNNQTYTPADGSLRLAQPPSTTQGSDVFGTFNATSLLWQSGAQLMLNMSLRMYQSGRLAILQTTALHSLPNTSNPTGTAPIIAAPSFALDGRAQQLAYAMWHGLWPQPEVGLNLSRTDYLALPPVRHDGPVAFSDTLHLDSHSAPVRATLLLVPLDDPLNTVYEVDGNNQLTFGPAGLIENIPQGYSYQVAFILGQGMTMAMSTLQQILQVCFLLKLDPGHLR